MICIVNIKWEHALDARLRFANANRAQMEQQKLCADQRILANDHRLDWCVACYFYYFICRCVFCFFYLILPSIILSFFQEFISFFFLSV